MRRFTPRYFHAVFAAALAVVITGIDAQAISHSTRLRAPLTEKAYPHCPVSQRDPVVDPNATADIDEETSETDCTGSSTLTSPWTFAQGTIDIDSWNVGLRLDDIRLKDGVSCPVSGECRCWNSTTTCNTKAVCGGTECGPSSAIAGSFSVRIWQQAYHQGGVLCGNGGCCPHLQRSPSGNQCDAGGCLVDQDFDLKNTTGSKNRDVDAFIEVNTNCGASSNPVEVRHAEVIDRYGNVVAVLSK